MPTAQAAKYPLFVLAALILTQPQRPATADPVPAEDSYATAMAPLHGERILVDLLFPQTRDWSSPTQWRIVPKPLPAPMVSQLIAASLRQHGDMSFFRSALKSSIFGADPPACLTLPACLVEFRVPQHLPEIVYGGPATEAEGDRWVWWHPQPDGAYLSFESVDKYERIKVLPPRGVVTYANDFHDGATFFALKQEDRQPQMVYVPLHLNTTPLAEMRELPIKRASAPCLFSAPEADRSNGSACEPIESVTNDQYSFVGQHHRHYQFTSQIEILARPKDVDLQEWRFVELTLRETAEPRDTPDPICGHRAHGPCQTNDAVIYGNAPFAGPSVPDVPVIHAAGWINLKWDPTTQPGWAFVGRP